MDLETMTKYLYKLKRQQTTQTTKRKQFTKDKKFEDINLKNK